MFSPNRFCNQYVNMMLRTYNTPRNNTFQRGFPCCQDILIFFVFLYAKNITFTCVSLLLFLLFFIIFIALLPFSMNFEVKFDLNFNSISFFHVNCKISFGFFLIKEKSLGLSELVSKM